MDKYEIINIILEDVDRELTDAEITSLLLETALAQKNEDRKETFGQLAADKLAKGAGSWFFVITFMVLLIIWIIINSVLALNAFDPFPFILLNLILSCLASIQAPLIMMSQNRQEEKDRQRALSDYKINLKTEFIIKELYQDLKSVKQTQEELLVAVKAIQSKEKKQKIKAHKENA